MSFTFGSNATIFDKLNPFPRVEDEVYTEIKKQALESLGKNEKKVFLNSFKTVVEAKFCNSSKNLREFEETLFQCKDNVQVLAVEGYCQNCRLYFPFIMETIDYFFLPANGEHMLFACERCNLPYSVAIRKYHGRENPLLADFQ